MKTAPIRTPVGPLLVALAFLSTLSLFAATLAPKEPETKPVEVTYFFLPG